jgi:glutathione S-transferase
MEDTLGAQPWLAGDGFSVADIALAPYVNRLAMLGMQDLWQNGRLSGVEDWFARIRSRDTFKSALLDWIPDSLRDELIANGRKSWPDVQRILLAA